MISRVTRGFHGTRGSGSLGLLSSGTHGTTVLTVQVFVWPTIARSPVFGATFTITPLPVTLALPTPWSRVSVLDFIETPTLSPTTASLGLPTPWSRATVLDFIATPGLSAAAPVLLSLPTPWTRTLGFIATPSLSPTFALLSLPTPWTRALGFIATPGLSPTEAVLALPDLIRTLDFLESPSFSGVGVATALALPSISRIPTWGPFTLVELLIVGDRAGAKLQFAADLLPYIAAIEDVAPPGDVDLVIDLLPSIEGIEDL